MRISDKLAPDKWRTKTGQDPDREREELILAILRRSLRDGVFLKRSGVGQMKPIFDGPLMLDPDRFSGQRFPG